MGQNKSAALLGRLVFAGPQDSDGLGNLLHQMRRAMAVLEYRYVQARAEEERIAGLTAEEIADELYGLAAKEPAPPAAEEKKRRHRRRTEAANGQTPPPDAPADAPLFPPADSAAV